MKFVAILSAALIGSASTFTPPMMAVSRSKGKKAVVNKSPPKIRIGPSPSAIAWANSVPSKALPYTRAPGTLDGSMLGDYGFDPLGFSTTPVGPWFFKNTRIEGQIGDLTWYREAELIHGRIAQLAVLGFIVPGLIGTLPGNEWTGVDAYSYTNPIDAFGNVPKLALLQIFGLMTFLEVRRINIIFEEGSKFQAGDLRIGQTGYNPFGLAYSPEEYEEKRLQELKHCRLAMVGFFGLWAQALASGKDIASQIGTELVVPEYVSKAGYFVPRDI